MKNKIVTIINSKKDNYKIIYNPKSKVVGTVNVGENLIGGYSINILVLDKYNGRFWGGRILDGFANEANANKTGYLEAMKIASKIAEGRHAQVNNLAKKL